MYEQIACKCFPHDHLFHMNEHSQDSDFFFSQYWGLRVRNKDFNEYG